MTEKIIGCAIEVHKISGLAFGIGTSQRLRKLPLIDHLVINEKKFVSFELTGALERLSKSKKYVLKYKEEAEKLLQKGREEGIKIGEERGLEKGREEGKSEGRKEERKEMAKGMKKEGIDIKTIAKLSGLSIAQIKKL